MAAGTLYLSDQVTAARRRAVSWPEWLALGGYVAFLAVLIPFHEPWADEAQAWQIVRSVSIGQLFRHQLRYEGSPGLWHFLLWIISRLHISYAGMHWVTGAIATLGAALLIFYAPFPRYIRLALPFTFFLAYQYAVVARSYSLVPPLLFALAIVWRRNAYLTALLLGLLGNVSLHACAISGGFALLYTIENRRRIQQLIVPLLILVSLYGVAFWTVVPRPADLSFHAFQLPPGISKPILFLARFIFSLLWSVSSPIVVLLVAFVGMIVFAVKMARQRLLVYLLPLLTFGLFSMYYSNFWHAGLVVPTLITICWIAWPEVRILGTGIAAFAAFCILLHLGWTAHAAIFDIAHNYSPDAEAARFLKPHITAGETVALTYIRNPDTNAFHSIGLAPYFDGPIFINQQRPYWLWSENEHTDAQFEEALQMRPRLVLDVYYKADGTRFSVDRDLKSARVTHLTDLGYRLTHVFCGEKPEGFHEREEICDLIFEK